LIAWKHRVILADVNVLVYAFREDAGNHKAFRGWLESIVNADEAYAISGLVLSGFLRIVTHPQIFRPPSPIERALSFARVLHSQPNAVPVEPGPRHWDIFQSLCRSGGVKGNLVADAYLAALAIESGCEWITTDRDYSRFDGLRWRHPLG
jgi:toxin-antitoxin system PIN domain toxin